MSAHVAGRSAALGFWVKHQMAMEAFEYRDEEEPPIELREIFDDPASFRLLEAVLDSATIDGNELVHSIVSAVSDEWSKSRLIAVERKRKSTTWDERIGIRRKRSLAGNMAQVCVSIESGDADQLHLYCYLWTKGGRRAAIFNAQQVRQHLAGEDSPGPEDAALLPEPGYWNSGVILLAKLPLHEFIEDDSLDLLKLHARALASVLRCSGSAIERILSSE